MVKEGVSFSAALQAAAAVPPPTQNPSPPSQILPAPSTSTTVDQPTSSTTAAPSAAPTSPYPPNKPEYNPIPFLMHHGPSLDNTILRLERIVALLEKIDSYSEKIKSNPSFLNYLNIATSLPMAETTDCTTSLNE